MTALEGSLGRTVRDLGAQSAVAGDAARRSVQGVKELGQKAAEKTWDGVKNFASVGARKVTAMYTESLGRRIGRAQGKMEKLSGQIRESGADTATLRDKQVRLAGKIHKWSEVRSEKARGLAQHYTEKLKKPREQREGIVRELANARDERNSLKQMRDSFAKERDDLNRQFDELVANRDYQGLQKMADIKDVLRRIDSRIKQKDDVIDSAQRAVDASTAGLENWNKKHSYITTQETRWSQIGRDGTHGTGAEKLPSRVKQNPPSPSAIPPASRSAPISISRTESSAGTTEGVSEDVWREVGRLIQMARLRNIPHNIAQMLKRFDGQVQKEAIPTEVIVDAWNKLADQKPKSPRIGSIDRGKLRNINAEMTLIQFGTVLHTKLGLDASVINAGVEKIAVSWDKSLN